MSCILRVSGDSLDIDSLLSQHSLVPDRIWKKGEPRSLKGKIHTDSGASFLVSGAELDEFPRQVIEATKFLEINASVIAKIVAFPGVQNAVLDFGVALTEGYVAQFSYLPANFIQLAAKAEIAVEISHYACCTGQEES